MQIYEQFCEEQFHPDGKLAHFSLAPPKNFNFAYDVMDALAEKRPDDRALVWCNALGEEKILSYADLRAESNRMANVLRAHGIEKGDTVVVMLKRHYEYWFAALALSKLGAVMAPVTHMLTVSDLVYRVENGKIRAAICTSEEGAPQRFLDVKSQTALSMVFTVRAEVAGCIPLTQEMQSASDVFARVETALHEPILTYFTSGTTGNPKGVIHDHSYPLAHIVTAKYWHQVEAGGLHFTVAETGWAKASWGKLYGQWLLECAVMVFDFDNFDPRQLMQVIARYEVTSFCAPPTIYRYMAKTGFLPMPSLKHISAAGEPLSSDVYLRVREQLGLSIMEGYGQTETTPILANLSYIKSRPGSMGFPTPLYRVALHDQEGKPTPQGEIGEIVILPNEDGSRPIGIFAAYCDRPELYENAWRGGVYHTGDTAFQDEDGYYWFNGRNDDIIKTGGYRVGPFEIENVLTRHPAVLECSVVGIPDKLRGQAIKAYVLLAEGYEASAALTRELKLFCNEQTSDYKWVRHIDFVETMPKTISVKIKKRELHDWETIVAE